MAACQFTIPFNGSAEDILQKAKSAVESQGGTFTGDLRSGIFKVSLLSNEVEGSYLVENNELELTIDKKPIFVPCNAIEGFLKSKLSK